jgi:hypothetical protein
MAMRGCSPVIPISMISPAVTAANLPTPSHTGNQTGTKNQETVELDNF